MANVDRTDYNLSKFLDPSGHTLHLIRVRRTDFNSSENQERPESPDLE